MQCEAVTLRGRKKTPLQFHLRTAHRVVTTEVSEATARRLEAQGFRCVPGLQTGRELATLHEELIEEERRAASGSGTV